MEGVFIITIVGLVVFVFGLTIQITSHADRLDRLEGKKK